MFILSKCVRGSILALALCLAAFLSVAHVAAQDAGPGDAGEPDGAGDDGAGDDGAGDDDAGDDDAGDDGAGDDGAGDDDTGDPDDAGGLDAGDPPAGEDDAGPSEPDESENAGASDAANVGAESPSVDSVRPPRPVDRIEAAYPPEALAARAAGTTVALLHIDAEGQVQECTVVESAGRDDFDLAACEVLGSTRFVPAMRGETPIAVRVRFAVPFELPPGATPPPEATPTDVSGEPEAEPSSPSVPPGSFDADVTDGEAAFGAAAEIDAPIGVELRRSAQAVQVVELETASEQSADLGEVLARQQGVGVRRSGGLGSTVRFSLNGLTDDQIRFFLDGVPLVWMGFPLGVGDVPVNLIEHVEIYRGVVPVRFGTDALGGAVNLRSRDPAYAPSASFSYQGGSFNTHRFTLEGGHHFRESGFYARARTFVDRTDNDYEVLVDLADPQGRPYEGRVRRSHDAYLARGGNIELGVADRSWADSLSVRLFLTDFAKEVQHNVSMRVPYGEVEFGETAGGAVLRYENEWDHGSLSVVAAYNVRRTWFTDVAECTYDWYSRCVAEVNAGEIGRTPFDQRLTIHAGYLRASGEYRPTQQVAMRFAVAPSFSARTGENLADGENALDLADIPSQFFGMVAGAELQLDLWEERIEALLFAKYYLQSLWSEEIVAPQQSEPIDHAFHRPGFGAALRLLITDQVYVKASYEWATRLLRADELFGDGSLVAPNLELRPEVSHNVNLSLAAEDMPTAAGKFRGNVNLFLRLPDELVVLLGRGEFFQYQNVTRARSLGFEVAAGWTSPGDYVALDANLTYQDFRNVSDEGVFGAFDGDRIPNRPYLFANGTMNAGLGDVLLANDRLSLTYYLRWVHEFFRNWESVGAGRPDIKDTIDSQLVHSAALSYTVRDDAERRLTTSIEVQNIGDARVFDTFGIQRPGRAVYFKISGDL